MATRIHRLAGACLLTTGLLMSCMSGAIASADSENNAKSDSSPGTNSSTSEGGRTSTTSTTSTAKTDTSADDPVAAAERVLKNTGVSGAGADKPTSTVSAQTNTSSGTADTAGTAGTESTPDAKLPASPEASRTAAAEPTAVAVVADPPATAGLQIQTPSVDEVLAGTGALSESAANSTANSAAPDATTSSSDTAESAQPLASTSSATSSVTASVTASAEDTSTSPVETTSTAAPAATSPEAPVATPTFRDAVVYFLRVLATAKNFVDAIMRLPAEIRAALGIPWNAPSVGDYHALMSTPNVALLNLLVVSLSQAASDPGSPVAVHRSGSEADGGITLLTAQRQQLAPAPLAAPAPPHRSVPTVIKDIVAAIVVSLSLWSIFYAALPGLGGLLSFGAAGVRIGYRQANAGIALHTTEVARFLRPGPIGVVRTGSLVSVHSRSTPPSGRTTQQRHLKLAA